MTYYVLANKVSDNEYSFLGWSKSLLAAKTYRYISFQYDIPHVNIDKYTIFEYENIVDEDEFSYILNKNFNVQLNPLDEIVMYYNHSGTDAISLSRLEYQEGYEMGCDEYEYIMKYLYNAYLLARVNKYINSEGIRKFSKYLIERYSKIYSIIYNYPDELTIYYDKIQSAINKLISEQ